MKKELRQTLSLIGLSFVVSSCGLNLHSTSLKIGLVNQTYEDTFYVESDPLTWNDDNVMRVTRGSLPPGIELTGDGRLIGTPTELGDFTFRVTSYGFSDDFWDDDDWWDDDDDYSSDSEWYTLFVTEAPTNASCPSPDDEALTEIYVCLGDVTRENLDAGETFEVDVNHYIDFNNGRDYDLRTVDFTVYYDAALFEPVGESLNSQMLREAATRTDASVSATVVTPGELRVTLAAVSQDLHKSGRLMNLPFAALQNVPAGDYAFTAVFNGVASGDDDTVFPALVEIDGNVSVTEGVYEESAGEEDAVPL